MPIFPDNFQPLNPGDTIGIAAPASCFDADLFQKGLDILKTEGFKIHVPKAAYLREGYLAGTDQERVQAFIDLWENPDVKAVICARGGYGAMRILPLLDFDRIKKSNKILVGYSDITCLMETLMARCKTPVFHGPVITGLGKQLDQARSLARCLQGDLPSMLVPEKPVVISHGKTQGILAGGNLTTLIHMAGTPYQPDYSEKIIFLEDVGEAPYRIDRMLTHLRLSGILDGVRGIVLGSFHNCGEGEEILRVMQDCLGSIGIPVLGGIPAGHGADNQTFPMGVSATLDTEQAVLGFS